ncbi:hypothetical protein ACJ73_02464 [Blastomyces percursus]|uniref:Chromo domain-containing protein n=1 Tax=Blastomyces percursus TaxID=1658174 RepID=A0A1J9QDH9_9EURO|nr:hypothetical protein ACJ73_02464 [Blastomyces percursus]
MSPSTFNPRPACPNPIQWDVPARIALLQSMISNPATSEPEKKNLQTAIALYESGDLPGRFKYIQDGKVVPLRSINFQRPYWVEGFGQQLSSQAVIPATVPVPSSQPVCDSPSSQQLAHRMTYPQSQGLGHQIYARIRPVPDLLSPAFSIDVMMLNDTGSNTMTVFDTDLTALAIPPTYRGLGPEVPITTAGGTVTRKQIIIEVQLVDFQGNPVSEWIREGGIVAPADPGASRLSGDGIRQSLYFATAPGNQYLYVAAKKQVFNVDSLQPSQQQLGAALERARLYWHSLARQAATQYTIGLPLQFASPQNMLKHVPAIPDSPPQPTPATEAHAYFGNFKIFFEAMDDHLTDLKHTYKIHSSDRGASLYFKLPVMRTLLLSSNHTVDPPSSKLLALHRAIAIILDLSAAGEYIDRIIHDSEQLWVRSDGSTELGHIVSLNLGGQLHVSGCALVDEILESMMVEDQEMRWYLVKWRGYDPSWQPEYDLIPGCEELVRKFHARSGKVESRGSLKRRGRPPLRNCSKKARSKISGVAINAILYSFFTRARDITFATIIWISFGSLGSYGLGTIDLGSCISPASPRSQYGTVSVPSRQKWQTRPLPPMPP